MAAITAGAPDPDVAASALAAEEASSAAFLALGMHRRQSGQKKKLPESGMSEVLLRQQSVKNKPPSMNANGRKKRQIVLPSVNANVWK